jgi:hypothetical protein
LRKNGIEDGGHGGRERYCNGSGDEIDSISDFGKVRSGLVFGEQRHAKVKKSCGLDEVAKAAEATRSLNSKWIRFKP